MLAVARQEFMMDPADQEWSEKLHALEPLIVQWHDADLSLRAAAAAKAMGLASSRDLHKWLNARGLPPYLILRDRYYVVRLVELCEHSALAKWALDHVRDPSAYSRFIKRVKGLPWREVQRRGVAWAKGIALETWRPYGRRE